AQSGELLFRDRSRRVTAAIKGQAVEKNLRLDIEVVSDDECAGYDMVFVAEPPVRNWHRGFGRRDHRQRRMRLHATLRRDENERTHHVRHKGNKRVRRRLQPSYTAVNSPIVPSSSSVFGRMPQ